MMTVFWVVLVFWLVMTLFFDRVTNRRWYLVFLLYTPMGCVDENSTYFEGIESITVDSCINALSEYENCNWGVECQQVIQEDYPESWEPAKVTFELCYLDSPRCEALEEGCEAL